MCCLLSTIWLLGPRFGFLIYWFTAYGRLHILAAFNTWIWPLLGLIFLPWTTLMYTLVAGPGGIFGFDWLWLGLAFLADISAYGAGAARRRDARPLWLAGSIAAVFAIVRGRIR